MVRRTRMERATRMPREQAAALLDRIAQGIGSGRLTLRVGEEQLTLMPRGNLHLDLLVRADGDRGGIELSIGWSVVCSRSTGATATAEDPEAPLDDETATGPNGPPSAFEHDERSEATPGGRGGAMEAKPD